jgi:hypothetical protein
MARKQGHWTWEIPPVQDCCWWVSLLRRDGQRCSPLLMHCFVDYGVIRFSIPGSDLWDRPVLTREWWEFVEALRWSEPVLPPPAPE